MIIRKRNIIIGIILLLIGILVLGIGILRLNEHNEKKKTYIDVTGVVIDYEVSYNDDDEELYAPVVEYFVNGRRYETVSDSYSYPPKYDIGESVRLMYNPRNPQDVIFKHDNTSWIFMLIGGVFSAVGCLLIFMKQNRKG